MPRIVVLISGRGSNMQALLEARLPAEIAAVVSNDPGAKGLEIARAHGTKTEVVDHRDFPDRAGFDRALAETVARYEPDLIVLAGFMRVLTESFVSRFAGRMLNIHPSLLPAFPGTNTHRRALQEGVKIHGCTVHFVTPDLDHGPIVVQAAVPVHPDDTEAALAARVLEQEHRVLPQAVLWFLEQRLTVHDNRAQLFGECRFPAAIISPMIA